MAFRYTQLGRFGEYAVTLKAHPYDDPDQQVAHLYANNGVLTSRPLNAQDVLDHKGIWDQSSSKWGRWRNRFDLLCQQYAAMKHLHASCTTPSPRCPPYPHHHNCWHELVPPLEHYNLEGFAKQALPNVNDNLITRGDGTLGLPPDPWPIWNFVVTLEGEILLSQEDFGTVKHPSISGGRDVWSAGQVGFENHQVRLVDLQSGHFVRPHVQPGTSDAQDLIAFTEDVFRGYEYNLMTIPCLHRNFICIWS